MQEKFFYRLPFSRTSSEIINIGWILLYNGNQYSSIFDVYHNNFGNLCFKLACLEDTAKQTKYEAVYLNSHPPGDMLEPNLSIFNEYGKSADTLRELMLELMSDSRVGQLVKEAASCYF